MKWCTLTPRCRCYSTALSTPRSRCITSLRYLRSPRELIRIAGSLPFFPQRLIVRGDTLSKSATSRIVNRSGKSVSDSFLDLLLLTDMVQYYRGAFQSCQAVGGPDLFGDLVHIVALDINLKLEYSNYICISDPSILTRAKSFFLPELCSLPQRCFLSGPCGSSSPNLS